MAVAETATRVVGYQLGWGVEATARTPLLVGSVFADFNAVQARSVQSGANVTIAYDAQNGIVLQNVALANLDSSDFFFV